jgi:radical SAM protein with 4Fe4S-binding SPASM domain
VTQHIAHLKRVYWESTAGCNLRCIHCRRLDVLDKPDPDELTTAQAKKLIDEVATFGRPVFIFSGGEPLVRHDLFELAAYAKEKGLPIALATNGTLVDAAMARRIKDVGIYYASVSLDGSQASTHDTFRGPGAFEKTLQGMRYMQEAGIKVQVNYTVAKMNVHEVPKIYELTRERKAIALYLFLLVPVGCGVKIADDQMLSSAEVETWLQWVAKKDQEGPLPLKAICAPQYFRVEHEILGKTDEEIPSDRKGCLAGLHMCFVSHKGDVTPCGYLPLPAGNIRKQSFRDIWENSALFRNLRDSSLLSGRCGSCDFKDVCGGCRARGFYAYGHVQAEEPYCVTEPHQENTRDHNLVRKSATTRNS